MGQRVAVFIDVQNYYYGSKDEFKAKVDYHALMNYILDGRDMIRGIAYIVETKTNNQHQFKEVLKELGLEVRTKQLIERSDGSTKGNWDIAITVDAMLIAPRVDTVVIASGDGDFMYLAEALKNMGCKVEAYGFRSSTSDFLRKSVTEYHDLPKSILQRKRRKVTQ